MLFEIRNYHFDSSKFEAYKIWAAKLAVPYLKSKMDIVGFWVNNDMVSQYGGSLPQDETDTPANITWIIRWRDREQREKVLSEELRSNPDWQVILNQVPGGLESYLKTEVKFATEI